MDTNTEEYVDLEEAEQKDVFNCKCPGCGAELEYDPTETMLKCPFCGATKEINWNNKASEQAFEKLFTVQHTWTETSVVVCKNCGVKEVVNNKEIGKSCSYCGTPNVVKSEELSGLKPNAVVPFEKTKDEAAEAVKIWAKKKFYAVRKFKKNVNPEEINGVYNPAFTFDANTTSPYTGKLGKDYYVTVTRNGKNVRERRTRWFSISGTCGMFFDDILVEASENVPQKFLNQLIPFDTNNSQAYQEAFILGFSANQYSKDGQKCWDDATLYMHDAIRKKILSQYDYDRVDRLDFTTSYSNRTFKYLLLPIYVGHCAYNSKNYNFFVNGKTCKVAGKVPISVVKVLITIFAILAVLVGIVVLIIAFGGNE